MKTATRVDAVVVMSTAECEGTKELVVACADHDAYQALPQVVSYDGDVYGRTGWNSDQCVAYYRLDAHVARAVH